MNDSTNEVLLENIKPKAKKSAKEKPQDFIIATANQLENMSREEAYASVRDLADAVDLNYFKLGGTLAVIQHNSDWWRDEGFDNFRAFIEAKFGLHYRKAMYLIGIYGRLVESGVPYEPLAHLGWSKIKELAQILTLDNMEDWIARAEDLTVLQLHEAVKKALMGALDKTDTEADTGNVTTFSVKVHPDQKESINLALDKALIEASTEFKGVALEAICLNYLSGAKVAKPKTLDQLLSGHSYMDVLAAFSKLWPDIELTVTLPEAAESEEV